VFGMNKKLFMIKFFVYEFQKYMDGIKRNEIPMPQDMVGKDKIVFGNIQQIYEWHKR
jgi:hypothetical protein